MAITQYENKKLQLNTALRGYSAGAVVNIRVDKKGVPLDPYWRGRLKDSRIDKCVEILLKTKAKKNLISEGDKK